MFSMLNRIRASAFARVVVIVVVVGFVGVIAVPGVHAKSPQKKVAVPGDADGTLGLKNNYEQPNLQKNSIARPVGGDGAEQIHLLPRIVRTWAVLFSWYRF